jgi:hypothetical protein
MLMDVSANFSCRDIADMEQEMARIPGISARWASAVDGHFPPVKDTSSGSGSDLSQIAPYGQHQNDAAISCAPPGVGKHKHTRSIHSTGYAPAQPITPPPAAAPQFNHIVPPITPPPGIPHPYVRREPVPMYKNRACVYVVQDGKEAFIDPAAVHVGRLNRDKESKDTLETRFKVYGEIVSIYTEETDKLIAWIERGRV